MPEPISASFEIVIDGEPGDYKVGARGPGVLTQRVPFVWPPPGHDDLETTLLRLETAFELSLDQLKDFGTILYQALFPEEIDDAYQRLVGKGDPFRLRLIAHPPELARLPWEFLYDEGSSVAGWLALQHRHPLVRSVPDTGIAGPLEGEGPLRVLFVGASPAGWPPLDVEEDARRLREGLKPLVKAGLVELLDPVMHLTPDILSDKLRDEPHVLHYSGHGDFDEEAGKGYLILEDDAGKEARMGSDKLAVALRGRTVRLVLLSACRTAQIDENQPFVGVGQQLANASNLPAVTAMQYPIGDKNAIAFNKEFYRALADRFPVDQAITEARQAIWRRTDESGGGRALVDWAAPVLFMLGSSGALWEGTMDDKREREEQEDRREADRPRQNISIGGNVGGDVKMAEGDIIEGDHVEGDKVAGDKVDGDKITVGDISGSKGIAVGRGAQAHVTEGADAVELAKTFAQIVARLKELEDAGTPDVDLAREVVEEIEEEAVKGDDADESLLTRQFRKLALMGPEIVDVVTATLLGGPVGALAAIVVKVAEKARADNGLDPVS